MSDVQDWKPGDKCRVCGCEVTIAAIAGEDVWCRDANGQHYTHALDDLRPLSPAPETCGCEEYLDSSSRQPLPQAYPGISPGGGTIPDVSGLVRDAWVTAQTAASQLKAIEGVLLDGHAEPPAPAPRDDRLRELEAEVRKLRASRDAHCRNSKLLKQVLQTALNGAGRSAKEIIRELLEERAIEKPAPALVDREKLVDALKAVTLMPITVAHVGADGWRHYDDEAAEHIADALLPLLAGGDAALRAEVERLRAALREIALDDYTETAAGKKEIARAALAQGSGHDT